MALTVHTRNVGDVAIVDLSGRITLGEGSVLLRDSLKKILSDGTKKIVLNLKDVSYVDSSGLGELVGIYTSVTNQGGTVKLVNLQAKVISLLQVTKLHTVFETFDNEQKAVQSFS